MGLLLGCMQFGTGVQNADVTGALAVAASGTHLFVLHLVHRMVSVGLCRWWEPPDTLTSALWGTGEQLRQNALF